MEKLEDLNLLNKLPKDIQDICNKGILDIETYIKYKDNIPNDILLYSIRKDTYTSAIYNIFNGLDNFIKIVDDPLFYEYAIPLPENDNSLLEYRKINTKEEFINHIKNSKKFFLEVGFDYQANVIKRGYFSLNDFYDEDVCNFINYIGLDNLIGINKTYGMDNLDEADILYDDILIKFAKLDNIYKTLDKKYVSNKEINSFIDYFSNKTDENINDVQEAYNYLRLLINYSRFNFNMNKVVGDYQDYSYLKDLFPNDLIDSFDLDNIIPEKIYKSVIESFVNPNDIYTITFDINMNPEYLKLLENKTIILPEYLDYFYKRFEAIDIVKQFAKYNLGLENALLIKDKCEEYFENHNLDECMDFFAVELIKKGISYSEILGMPDDFKKRHKEIFIEDNTPYFIKGPYYGGHLLSYMNSYSYFGDSFEYLCEVMKDIDLGILCNIKGRHYNIFNELSKNFSNKEILTFISTYPLTFDYISKLQSFYNDDNHTLNRKEMENRLEELFIEALKNNDSIWKNEREKYSESFKAKHPEFYLKTASGADVKTESFIRTLFDRRNLYFYNLTNNLKDNSFLNDFASKSIYCFERERDREFLQKFIDRKISLTNVYNVMNYYGEIFDRLDMIENDITENILETDEFWHGDIKFNLENLIFENIYNYLISYGEEKIYVKDLASRPKLMNELKKVHPEIVLDDFDSYLYYEFYGHNLTFREIEDLPEEEIKLLKTKDCKHFFMYDDVKNLFEKYGNEKAIDYGIKHPYIVDYMAAKGKIDNLIYWNDKYHFLPDKCVMSLLPTSYSDKLVKNGKKWSKIMKAVAKIEKDYDDNFKDGIIKAAVVFGVLEDDKGYNTFLENVFLRSEFSLGFRDYLESIGKNKLFDKVYEKSEFGYRIKEIPNILSDEYIEILTIYNEEYGNIFAEQIHALYGGFAVKYDEDFRNFFLNNYEELMKDDRKLTNIQRQFNNIKVFNRGRGVTLENALDYIKNIHYENIEFGNVNLAELASKVGYSEEDFNKLQQIYHYSKLRTTSSIPRIIGDYQDFKYEITKLNDPISLVIGNITDCCQALDDGAETSMIHSATDPNGRLFIIRDEANEIIAQSWVWRNNQVLCFDNIEIPKKVLRKENIKEFAKKVLSTYQQASLELIKKDELILKRLLDNKKITEVEYNNRVLKTVTVGLGYNDIADTITENLSKFDKNITPMTSYDPTDKTKMDLYLDSDSQYLLAGSQLNKYESLTKSNDIYHDEFDFIDLNNMTDNEFMLLKELKDDYLYESDDTLIEDVCYENEINKEDLKIVLDTNFAFVCEDKDNIITIKDIYYDLREFSEKEQDIIYNQMKTVINDMGNNNKLIIVNEDIDCYDKITKKGIKR